MVGSSVEMWQEMQPEDLLSASSCDWPRNKADSCDARIGGFELACKARKKDNAETQRTPSARRVEDAGWRSLFMVNGARSEVRGPRIPPASRLPTTVGRHR